MVHNKLIDGTLVPAGVSVATASFFADTLPQVQWMASFVAICAGVTAILWTAYKFLKSRAADRARYSGK